MQIEHECPQCGAPVVLDETDRLLSCSFCKTKLFMQVPDHFRYCLSPRDPFLEDVFYVPYWRFKGMRFLCKTSGIQNGLVDKTFLAIENSGFSSSLGLRTQSLKLKLAKPGNKKHFLKPTTPFDPLRAAAGNTVEYELVRTPETRIVKISEDDYDMVPDVRLEMKEERIFHEAFLADTLSLIYAPYYIYNEKVHDGVTNDVLGTAPGTIINADTVKDDWRISFLPTICPNCGWDTVSGRDSCTVFCMHCSRVWHVTEKGLFPAVFARMTSNISEGKSGLYLPFWRISVNMTGVKLGSYADFIRFTNIPRALQPAWEDKPFYFWFPAFKTAPSAFLRMAKQLTIANPEGMDDLLPRTSVIPVNLPLHDAFESARTLIADLTLRKKIFFPTLGSITTSIREALLVLIPFTENNHELIQPDMNFSLFKNAIKIGQNI
ncbi:MAG: hypothetical protein H6Q52_1971 [Deltaproteobacteria bacterium]|nr:hypothetical protein [Deltaproteobacteria bacterium]